MCKRTASTLAVIVLSCALAGACFAQAEETPSKTPSGPPTGPTSPVIAPGPATLVPSPCVINALRVLHPHRMQMLSDRLKLTEDQKSKISDILAKSEEALRPLIANQRLAAEECVTALTRSGLKEQEILLAADLAAKAESAILAEKIKTLLAVRAALNADQAKELNDMIDQTTIYWRGGRTPGGMREMTPGAPKPEPKPAAAPK